MINDDSLIETLVKLNKELEVCHSISEAKKIRKNIVDALQKMEELNGKQII